MYHFFWYIAWHEMGYNRVKVGCTYGIYLKVVYTVWGIYHANYDTFHAIKVANEVCTHLWKEGPTALLHLNPLHPCRWVWQGQ